MCAYLEAYGELDFDGDGDVEIPDFVHYILNKDMTLRKADILVVGGRWYVPLCKLTHQLDPPCFESALFQLVER